MNGWVLHPCRSRSNTNPKTEYAIQKAILNDMNCVLYTQTKIALIKKWVSEQRQIKHAIFVVGCCRNSYCSNYGKKNAQRPCSKCIWKVTVQLLSKLTFFVFNGIKIIIVNSNKNYFLYTFLQLWSPFYPIVLLETKKTHAHKFRKFTRVYIYSMTPIISPQLPKMDAVIF